MQHVGFKGTFAEPRHCRRQVGMMMANSLSLIEFSNK